MELFDIKKVIKEIQRFSEDPLNHKQELAQALVRYEEIKKTSKVTALWQFGLPHDTTILKVLSDFSTKEPAVKEEAVISVANEYIGKYLRLVTDKKVPTQNTDNYSILQ